MDEFDNVEERVEAGVAAMDELEAQKKEEFKQRKREAAQRFKERRAEEKVRFKEDVKALTTELHDSGIWDQLSDESKRIITKWSTPKPDAIGGTSFFNKMFGDNPQVGDSVTLREAFERTLKGQNNIDYYVTKRWPERGIIVKFEKNDNILESTYTIESLGE